MTLERLVILDEGGVIYTYSGAVCARPSVEGHYDVRGGHAIFDEG